MVRRMGWTGYRILYKRKCDFTGDDVITFYHPKVPYKIYRQDVWWSDKWDPKTYGREYDFSRQFFEQFDELLKSVPLPSLHNEYTTLINSEYCNGVGSLKNCYLCFQSGAGATGNGHENTAYTHMVNDAKDCMDLSFSGQVELCYEVVRAIHCYRALYSLNCEDCHDIYFCMDCVGCTSCIGCVNLRNKSYCIFNKQYTSEEFTKKLSELNLGSRSAAEEMKKKTQLFFVDKPRKAFHGRKNVNMSGDYITHSKNARDSYLVQGGEDVRFSQILSPAAKCYDYTLFGVHAEWMYECAWDGLNTNMLKFCFWNYHAHHLDYCFGCHGSENLFGCVGIRKGSYCILNKQYTKEEYGTLVSKIKEQMSKVPYVDRKGRVYAYGEFFPPELSPWAFNESMASLGFVPFTKEQALAFGFTWRDDDPREYQASTAEIPDHINDVPDAFTKEMLKCIACGKNYRIVPKELDFYRRISIPVPQKCPLCRERDRVKQLNPIKLYPRACAKCSMAMQTSYAPDCPEIVYCESCYNSEVV